MLKPRELVGVRGAGIAFDGLYYVKSVTSTIKRGEFKQSFELSRNGLVSIHPGCRHESRAVLRQYRGTVAQQHRPGCRSGGCRSRCPMLRDSSRQLGDALLSRHRQADGRVSWCRRSAPASGSSSSRAIRDYPIWSGCWYGSAAEVPALALAGIPVSPNIVLQTAAQNAIVISDLPGPTGGIMLKSATGATLIVNDTGIYIQNGKGASDHDDRPDGHHQQRRAGRWCSGRGLTCLDSSFISAPRCSVPMADRRSRPSPNPRVPVSGQPTVTQAAPYVGGGLPVRRRQRRRARA